MPNLWPVNTGEDKHTFRLGKKGASDPIAAKNLSPESFMIRLRTKFFLSYQFEQKYLNHPMEEPNVKNTTR
jgi:hypothetical protein